MVNVQKGLTQMLQFHEGSILAPLLFPIKHLP